MKDFRVENKVVLVTGSTRGIGRQIALDFLEQGNYVIINGTRNEKEISQELEYFIKYNKMYCYYQFDITDRESMKLAIEDIKKKYGRIDILVNNAGIIKDKTLGKLEAENWDKVINVNLTGAFNVCKEVIPIMRGQKFGRIINISSVIGLSGNYGQTNYSASKAGLIGFSKSLALEMASYGITVNTVAPGYIATEMTNRLPSELVDKIKSKIPIRDFGSTKDVSNVVTFLAKEESRYITGETISVNGGLYLK